jgi:hypothetical protein
MNCVVVPLDFLAALQMGAGYVHEVGVLREELTERLHVVPIPSVRKTCDHLADSLVVLNSVGACDHGATKQETNQDSHTRLAH